MAALTCDICGGKLKVGKNKISVCESCGMEHTIERVREKIFNNENSVHADSMHLIDNYYLLAKNAYKTEKIILNYTHATAALNYFTLLGQNGISDTKITVHSVKQLHRQKTTGRFLHLPVI